MKIIEPNEISPHVRYQNYIPVTVGQVWGPRTIFDPELILIVQGRFELEYRNRPPIEISRNQVLLIEPERSHVFRNVSSGSEAIISCIHFELIYGQSWASGDYQPSPAAPAITPVGGMGEVKKLFRRGAEIFAGFHRYRQEITDSIFREIWMRLSERWTVKTGPEISGRMADMVAFIRDNLTAPITRRDLARAFSLTPEHVNYLFRQNLGVTPTQFIHRERCLRAFHLIKNEGCNVQQAGELTGFSDAFHFSRVFKRVMGTPPSRI